MTKASHRSMPSRTTLLTISMPSYSRVTLIQLSYGYIPRNRLASFDESFREWRIVMRISSLLFVLWLSAILLPVAAEGCECLEYGTAVCAQYSRAKAVFIVLAMDMEQPRDKYGAYPEGTKVRFVVEEVFKGKVGKEVYDTRGNGADCKIEYEKGERYLIYDYGYDPKTRMIATSGCDGSTDLASAQVDIAYIRSLSTHTPEPSIMGRLLVDRHTSLAGANVTIDGMGHKYRAVTNDTGDFQVKVDNPGKYAVTVVVPFGAGVLIYASDETKLKQDEPTEKRTVLRYEVVLPKGQCSYKELSVFKVDLKATAKISGRVVDNIDQPVPHLTVYLYPVFDGQDFSGGDYEFAISKEDGSYEIEGLRAGSYFLGVNIGRIPDVADPYPTTFYPGVSKAEQARIIHLEQNQSLKGIDLHLPPRLFEREIKGVVLWPDGTPVAKYDQDPDTVMPPSLSLDNPVTLQYVSALRGPGDSGQHFDSKGNFSIVGFEDYTYLIHATAVDKNDRPMRSRYVKVKAGKDLKPITLVLSIPAETNPQQRKRSEKRLTMSPSSETANWA
jgi:hypothetical protein